MSEQPKKTKSVIIQIGAINNRTDKQYVFKSDNDFGLQWEYTNGVLVLMQRKNISGSDWSVIAHLRDFSMTGFVWKEVPNEENKDK